MHTDNEALAVAAQQGCEQSMRLLMEKNVGLVKQRANRARRAKGHEFDELVSVGWLGMRQSVGTYKADSSAKWSTHAVTWIDARISEYVNKERVKGLRGYSKNKLASVPVYARIADEMSQREGRAVSVTEAAAAVGIEADDIPSFAQPDGHRGHDDSPQIVWHDRTYIEDFDGDIWVEQIIGLVDEKHRRMVVEHVINGRSLSDMAPEYGVTRQAMYQRFKRVMSDLRERVEV